MVTHDNGLMLTEISHTYIETSVGFWYMMLFNVVSGYRHSEGTCTAKQGALQLAALLFGLLFDLKMEAVNSSEMWVNVCHTTASHPKRL
jgi:hypothetical protein